MQKLKILDFNVINILVYLLFWNLSCAVLNLIKITAKYDNSVKTEILAKGLLSIGKLLL